MNFFIKTKELIEYVIGFIFIGIFISGMSVALFFIGLFIHPLLSLIGLIPVTVAISALFHHK